MNLSSIEALPILQKNINRISHEVYFVPEFEKDSKELGRKFVTLGNDLKVFIEIGLKLYHELNIDNEGIRPLEDVKINKAKIYEAGKFACRAIKGKGAKSGIKVVYAHFEAEKRIELIEIYYKEDKENEDKNRILKYYQ
jgi:hypothetical protein